MMRPRGPSRHTAGMDTITQTEDLVRAERAVAAAMTRWAATGAAADFKAWLEACDALLVARLLTR